MSKESHCSLEDILGQLQSAFEGGEPFNVEQAAEALNCPKKRANARLITLARRGQLRQPARGYYCLDEEEDNVILVFRFDDQDVEHKKWVQRIMAEKDAKRRMNQWQQHVRA